MGRRPASSPATSRADRMSSERSSRPPQLPDSRPGALRVERQAAEDGHVRRRRALRGVLDAAPHAREDPVDLGDRAAEVARVGEHQHADRRAAAQLRGQRGDALAQVGDLLQGGAGEQDDEVGLAQQVGQRAAGAEPAAVGDHVDGREAGERPAERPPQPGHRLRLLGVGEPDEHVEAARRAAGSARRSGRAAGRGARSRRG
ncbi:hypothetical protein [Actinomadura madurae]|uniref:hypothetical protein n=1 Tax=Actinomadura madurae TaxID=1993 RepID=UPI0020D21F32|nr:hypothetical protein [Actinomadura madurae]MCQ0008599.1 hypothetical protein [Actinomadura madurae]